MNDKSRIPATGWKLEINKVDNGYLLEGCNTNDVDGCWKLNYVTVVEDVDEGDDAEVEHKTMKKLLQEVMNYFGVYTSKHNKVNCRTVLEEQK